MAKTTKANPCPPGVACSKCVYRKRLPQNPAGLCYACQREQPRARVRAAAAPADFRPDAELTRAVRAHVVTVPQALRGRTRHRVACVRAGTAVMVVPAGNACGWRDAVVELACGGRAFVPRDAIHLLNGSL